MVRGNVNNGRIDHVNSSVSYMCCKNSQDFVTIYYIFLKYILRFLMLLTLEFILFCDFNQCVNSVICWSSHLYNPQKKVPSYILVIPSIFFSNFLHNQNLFRIYQIYTLNLSMRRIWLLTELTDRFTIVLI